MEKVAEVRARQGRTDDVVAALKVALIDGTPETAEKYFEVARRLESWSMLSQARSFAETGVATAGPELLAISQHQSGVKLYVRIMTHLREQEKAYARFRVRSTMHRLRRRLSKSRSPGKALRRLPTENGDKGSRKTAFEPRVMACVRLLTKWAPRSRLILLPKKSSFAAFAKSKRDGMNLTDMEAFAIPLAQSAGLAEIEAGWRYQLMMQGETISGVGLGRMRALVDLQRRRLKFKELGSQLEQFAPRIEPLQRPQC